MLKHFEVALGSGLCPFERNAMRRVILERSDGIHKIIAWIPSLWSRMTNAYFIIDYPVYCLLFTPLVFRL